ncbi:Peptidase S1, PA clan [Phytophthora cactorum]|nr:Peptidase S1, PA clan [Phytophthora cactorum]
MGLSALATNAQVVPTLQRFGERLVPSNLSSDAIATSLKTGTTKVRRARRPEFFQTIPLAAADGSDIKYGEIVTHLGWYTTTGEGPRTRTHELQRADVQLMSNEECSKVTSVDDTRVCSHPIGNQNSCIGGYGGPLIVERPEGDVLVGMISWGDDCRKPGYPSYYSRIPVGHDWIESIITPNGATSGGPNPSLLAQSIASVYVGVRWRLCLPGEGEGENEDLAANTEEKEVEEDKESVDSVESKLRQRLGLWSSESRQGISDNREELSPAKSPEFVQSWGSVDWGSVDLEEMEEENEDPEEVIERTEAIEFRLSIDASVDRRDTGRRQLGMKPPLSPGFIEDSSKSVDYRSISSRGRIEEVESSICSADAKCASVDDGKEEENRSPVAEQEEKIAVRGEILASPNDNVSGRSQDSSSSDRREELIPTETTKTLDNLVSLVVHSWENDFFSTSESKEVDPTDDTREQVTESREGSNCIEDTPPNVKHPPTPQKMVPTQNIYLLKEKSTQPDQDDEEKEDDEVPGEEDDQIVQMLLGRISLLEEALRQIDI